MFRNYIYWLCSSIFEILGAMYCCWTQVQVTQSQTLRVTEREISVYLLILVFPLSALIVHEGPSVFRIFHRWQAVNQQWKVLNYDKLKDSEDPQKGSSTLRSLTLPLSNRGGVALPTSPSPSSSALTTAATVTITPGTTVPAVAMAPEDSSEVERHRAYSLLQLLSLNLRNQEPRNATTQPRNDNRELVMRVTTVWDCEWRRTGDLRQLGEGKNDGWTQWQRSLLANELKVLLVHFGIYGSNKFLQVRQRVLLEDFRSCRAHLQGCARRCVLESNNKAKRSSSE